MTQTPDPADAQAAASAPNETVDPRLLEVLICPVSRSALTYDRARGELISRQAGLAYPIRNGVPILLREEARDLDDTGTDPDASSSGPAPQPDPAPKTRASPR
ncbi:Trm112 family protein [bacterium]|nr:Trm112 family protein [bacterium]